MCVLIDSFGFARVYVKYRTPMDFKSSNVSVSATAAAASTTSAAAVSTAAASTTAMVDSKKSNGVEVTRESRNNAFRESVKYFSSFLPVYSFAHNREVMYSPGSKTRIHMVEWEERLAEAKARDNANRTGAAGAMPPLPPLVVPEYSTYTAIFAYETKLPNVKWLRGDRFPSKMVLDEYTELIMWDHIQPGSAAIGIEPNGKICAVKWTGASASGEPLFTRCGNPNDVSTTLAVMSLPIIPADAPEEWIYLYQQQLHSVCKQATQHNAWMLDSKEAFSDVRIYGDDKSDPGQPASKFALLESGITAFRAMSQTSDRWVLRGATPKIIRFILLRVYSRTVNDGFVTGWTWEDFKQAFVFFRENTAGFGSKWIGWLCGCFDITRVVNRSNLFDVLDVLETYANRPIVKLRIYLSHCPVRLFHTSQKRVSPELSASPVPSSSSSPKRACPDRCDESIAKKLKPTPENSLVVSPSSIAVTPTTVLAAAAAAAAVVTAASKK